MDPIPLAPNNRLSMEKTGIPITQSNPILPGLLELENLLLIKNKIIIPLKFFLQNLQIGRINQLQF